MSTPGWYPDPAGTPGRYRFWDGRSWSATTSGDPTGAAPSPAAGPARSSRRGPLIALVAVILVAAIAGAFAIRSALDASGTRTTDPGPLPTSTVSGWDDSSPTSSPSPSPSPTPSPTPSETTEDPPPAEGEPCPEGDPLSRLDHPADGRVHGGGLSFPEKRDWTVDQSSAFTWAYDVDGHGHQTEPRWIAGAVVGALFTGDGFDAPRRATELVLECLTTTYAYQGFSSRRDVRSERVTVDGKRGWSLRSEIRVDNPEVEAEGDEVEVIVVDTGSPESLAMFVGWAPIGDRSEITILDRTVGDLRVD